jgi:hypothetical protein
MEKNYRDNNTANVPEVVTSCVHVLTENKQTNPETKYQNAVTRTHLPNFHVSPHTLLWLLHKACDRRGMYQARGRTVRLIGNDHLGDAGVDWRIL